MNTNFTTLVSDVPVAVPVVPVEQLVATYTLYWDKMSKPPKEALQTIKGGNMSGKTDINPQWRMKVMTEVFGPVGFGWRYEIKRVWFEEGANDEVMCFAEVWVWYQIGGVWSAPIPGIGGNMLIDKTQRGLLNSDEGYKMAVTDALSVCFKAIGVAAEIYMGNWDGSKYQSRGEKEEKKAATSNASSNGKTDEKKDDKNDPVTVARKEAWAKVKAALEAKGYTQEQAPNVCGREIENMKKAKSVEEVERARNGALTIIKEAPEAQPA